MWVSRVYKQHNSLVLTLNGGMCRELGISRGDYLQFDEDSTEKTGKKLVVKRIAPIAVPGKGNR